MEKVKRSILLASCLSMFIFNSPQNTIAQNQTKYIVEARELKMPTIEKFPVIFYSSHPDDETLQMGPSIAENISQGHRVIVVLLTDGAETGARETVSGMNDNGTQAYCRWHKKTHEPQEEKYKDIYIDKKVVKNVRQNIEFYEACIALGVKPEDIIIYSFPDKELKKEDVKSVINGFEKIHPKAIHNTMTDEQNLENHPDHYIVGRAGLELLKEEKITNLNLFIKREFWKHIDETTKIITHVKSSEKDAAMVQSAINVYKNWNPEKGNYAFGYHSVPKAFDNLDEDKSSKYYRAER